MPLPRPISSEEQVLLKTYILYNPDTGILSWKKQRQKAQVGDEASTHTSLGYIIFTLNSRIYKAHRVAWFLFHNEWPMEQIDHLNGNKADNRICNLRKASCSQNQQNRKIHRSGRYVGVYHDAEYGGWIARAPKNFMKRKAKSAKYLGYFKTKEEAAQAIIDYCS